MTWRGRFRRPWVWVAEIEGVGKSGRGPGGAFVNHWQVRDMPYGWQGMGTTHVAHTSSTTF